MSEQCRAVSVCRSSVGAVSVDTGVEVSSSIGADSSVRGEQCRPVSGILDSGPPWSTSSSVGVSECRSVGVSGGCQVGVVSSSDEMLWIWMSQYSVEQHQSLRHARWVASNRSSHRRFAR